MVDLEAFAVGGGLDDFEVAVVTGFYAVGVW